MSGEIAPSLLGRQDLARYHTACTTMRNCWPSYKGPAVSRAGTKFCGFSKQTGRAYPPRLIPFQFSVNQGLALEFGHEYMRVLFDGAFVTEGGVAITGVSNASPAHISVQSESATAATAINSGVTSSYITGELITLAGGSYVTPTVIEVNSVLALNASPYAAGTGYAPGDTITLAGGTGTNPHVTVAATQIVSATLVSGGTGGTSGAAVVTGTTGTGTKFQLNVTITGGAITSINSIALGGAYTVNPSNLNSEPVSGASLSGAVVSVKMGVQALTITSGGSMTATPGGGIFTQTATSGAGTGATIICLLFGVATNSFLNPGVYSVPPTNPVEQAETTGSGMGVAFTMTYATSGAGPTYANGDWVYIEGVGGPTSLNGQTVVVSNTSNTGFDAVDVYGNPVSTIGQPAYTSGGTTSRVYTLSTPYSEVDLLWLKFVESADVMSLCCLNQDTGTSYAPLDLARISDTDWQFESVVPAPTVGPPGAVSGAISGSGSVDYQYQVTAVAQADGTESLASSTISIINGVDIANTQGTVTLTWSAVAGASTYYVYKTEPSYSGLPPVGATFGFLGQSLGLQFKDSNITPDYTQTPPQRRNPFAPGQISGVTATSGGTGYTQATGLVTTSTGSGAVLVGVVVNGSVLGWIVESGGQDYRPGDAVSVSGDGTGATAVLTIGPQTGTYPSVVAYFQERRAYANSLNNPDTYWMSQPGAFTNFDVRNPTIASDAITGSPWAIQVNGIQWMLQTSGGLLVMTGLSAWLLAGVGSFATNVQPISPSNQDDVPQAFSGCSPLIMPIKVNYDVIYLNWNNQYYYDLPYQLYALNEPIDLTEISSHLFTNYTIASHAWCEMPDKILWSVRSDGVMLSLTYYKTQQVQGWARHDTQGAFVSNCSVKEPPIDALYVATERFDGSARQCYMIERMAARTWTTVEDAWCVDAGLALAQPAPNALLTVYSAHGGSGAGAITGFADLVSGAGYSAQTTIAVADTNGGAGAGAEVSPVIAGGRITGITVVAEGAGYEHPIFVVTDPAGSAGGSGFSAQPVLSNAATFGASANVFSGGSVGSFIRAGGGIAVITAYTDAQHVTANILNAFPVVPNTGGQTVRFAAGEWTLCAPVTKVGGLSHLIGQTVTGLADGNVIPPTTVAADGSITLAAAASAVTVGLGFTAQIQSVPLDLGQPTVQGQRKIVSAITARLEASLGVEAVANQVDGSILSPPAVEIVWEDTQDLPDTGPGAPQYAIKPYNALALPLQTGDRRAPVGDGLARRGQIALEQNLPLPMTVLALIPEILPGDTPQAQWPAPKGKGR